MADLGYFIPGKLYKSTRILGYGIKNNKGDIHNEYKTLQVGNVIMFLGFQEYEYPTATELWMKVLCKGKIYYHFVGINGIVDQWYEAVKEE